MPTKTYARLLLKKPVASILALLWVTGSTMLDTG